MNRPGVAFPKLSFKAPEVYNCDAGYANWREGWSSGKKARWMSVRLERGRGRRIILKDLESNAIFQKL